MGDSSIALSSGKIKRPLWAFSTDISQGKKSLKALAIRLMPRKDSVKFMVFSHSGELRGLDPLIEYAGTVE